MPRYLAHALAESPEVRAAYARFEASVHRISRARRLPEPTLGFGLFVQPVETRVGPQRARISLEQAFPWPAKLAAGADAASARARAARTRLEAVALDVAQRVAEAYWALWRVRKERTLQRAHLELVTGLSETALSRVSTGAANLSDHQQIAVARARVEDGVHALSEAEHVAQARLRAAASLPQDAPVPTPQAPPDIAVPAEPASELSRLAQAHPGVASFAWLAEANEHSARAEAADRLPRFRLGADWIITDDPATPRVTDAGKDAVIVGGGVSLPLWQGSYADAESAARAEASARRAEQRAAADRARLALAEALSAVRDSARRVHLLQHTLLPQAEAAFASVLGRYSAGTGSVAATLLAQRDLLELRIEQARARARHASAWAWLDQVSGRELERVGYTPSERHGRAASTKEVPKSNHE